MSGREKSIFKQNIFLVDSFLIWVTPSGGSLHKEYEKRKFWLLACFTIALLTRPFHHWYQSLHNDSSISRKPSKTFTSYTGQLYIGRQTLAS